MVHQNKLSYLTPDCCQISILCIEQTHKHLSKFSAPFRVGLYSGSLNLYRQEDNHVTLDECLL